MVSAGVREGWLQRREAYRSWDPHHDPGVDIEAATRAAIERHRGHTLAAARSDAPVMSF